MSFYFGSHINVSEGLVSSAKRIKRAGGNLLQIFVDNALKLENEIGAFKKYLKDNDMKVVVHASYRFNLARYWDKYSFWIQNLENEIEFAHKIGAFGIVIHFGKKLDLSLEEAYNNMFTSLIYIHNRTKNKCPNVKLILETSVGQGTEICFKLEDLAYFFKKFKIFKKEIKDRFKLCIDSCHIFSAGYCLKTKNDVKLYLEAFEELIGLRYVGLIHLNDCKVDCGEQKDRHQNIGEGYIGFEGLKYFFDHFRKLKIPVVLETPNEGYRFEIKALKNKL